ncbi:MAG: MoaD/ThiS family protein [Paracoccaceae bacterium]
MAKIRVHLWSALRRYTDGADVVEVEASTTGQLLKALVDIHPGLDPVIRSGVSVVIDGKIYPTSQTEPVAPENEIYLMQRLRGG